MLKMSWTYATLLAFLIVLLALSLSPEVDSVSSSTGRAKDPQGPMKRIFMKEADASNFFRRRSRRGVKSQDEININESRSSIPSASACAATGATVEQRQVLAAEERKREFHEEKRNEFEGYAEEEHDEQNERTRESTEQWREFHYDGMHPPHEYNRHSI